MQEENFTQPGDPREMAGNLPETEQSLETGIKKRSIFIFANIISVILLAGLIILYILFFTSHKTETFQAPMALQKSGTKAISVVFVNTDTLNAKYELIKILRGDLENTGKRLQAEIMAEQSAFEKEANEFQKQIANNAIAEDKAKIIYEALMKKQQALVDKKDRYTQEVANKEMSMNLRLIDTVTNFLKRYNQKYRFDYILTYKTAGDILIANDTLDITADVVKALNTEYELHKKK